MVKRNDGNQGDGSAVGNAEVESTIGMADALLSDEDIRGIRGDMFSMQKRHKRNRILGKIATYLGIGAVIFAAGILTKDYVISAYENARDSIVSTAGEVKDSVASAANSAYEHGNAIYWSCNDIGYDITHTDPEEMGEDYMAKIDEYSGSLGQYHPSLLNVADKIIFSVDPNITEGQKGLEQITWSAFNRMGKDDKKRFVGEASRRLNEQVGEQKMNAAYTPANAQPKQ